MAKPTDGATRTARREVTIRYQEIPSHPRELHWEHCDALAEKGILWTEYETYGEAPDVAMFRPKTVEQEVPKIMCKGQTLMLETWQESTASTIIEFLREQGLKPRLGVEKSRTVEKKKYAGGNSGKVYVFWSDMGNDGYEDGHHLDFMVGNTMLTARLTGNTRQALFKIAITGPSDCMDSQEVEDVVSFVTHRIDNALRPLKYGSPVFDCSVDLHYSRTDACDVGWLANSMPKDAQHEGEEE